METVQGFDFQPLEFDGDGNPKGTGISELAAFVKQQAVTDVIFICHGFRNDENEARAIYGGFLKTLATNLKHASIKAKFDGRKFAVGGVLWPSMVFPEPDDSQQGKAQSTAATPEHAKRLEALKPGLSAAGKKRVDAMVQLLPKAESDPNAQLALVKHLMALAESLPAEASNEFKAALKKAEPEAVRSALVASDELVVTKPSGKGGAGGIPTLDAGPGNGGRAQSFLGNVFGFVPKFLNLTTFLFMFHRCGDIGLVGIHKAVRDVRAQSPKVRVHLVGHSLGGRAVTACAKGLTTGKAARVDTMLLLQAAFSHFGLSPAGTSPQGVKHPRGFFRDVVEQQAVRGPILATHSQFDTVVGFAYTAMAAASLNNARAFGDESSAFGGIGRNGVQDAPEVVQLELKAPGQAYAFDATKITNLNGSGQPGKPLIANHGDVMNSSVTWAFASALASAS